MTDLSHEPRLSNDTLGGVKMPLLYCVRGPHEHDETECYICSLCGVVYEDDAKNVCAYKLANRLPSVIVTRP